MKDLYVLILAGEAVLPVAWSREELPKQFLPIAGKKVFSADGKKACRLN